MNVQIRSATEKDILTLQAMYSNQLVFHNDIEDIWDPEWIKSDDGYNWIQGFIQNDHQDFFIAELDQKPIGFIQTQILDGCERRVSKYAHLYSIHVVKDYRRQGIGTLLMEFFYKYAKERKAERAQVGVVYNNPDANAFYKQQGFGDYLVVFTKDLT